MSKPKLRVLKAVPPSTSQLVSKMSHAFMLCRDFGHPWKAYTVDVQNVGRRKVFYETLLCTRCSTQKHREINSTGEIIRTSYSYPAGYLIPGWGRITKDDRAELRIAIIEILLSGETVEEANVNIIEHITIK
jgi:hypothetical protein